MTLLILLFSSEWTCVWACMCTASCAEAEEYPQNDFWRQNTHGFTWYNNSLATFFSSTLKSLSKWCLTSLPLLNTLPGSSFSELDFKPLCSVCHCVGHRWFNSGFSLVLFHSGTSCSSDLQHLFQLFLFSFSLAFIPSEIHACFHCGEEMTYFSLSLKAYSARSHSHEISAVLVSLLLPFPISC